MTDLEQTITKLKDTHRQEIVSKDKEIGNLKASTFSIYMYMYIAPYTTQVYY